ncbi:RNA polymerase sigma factor [[Clostridium] scindens]|uniref:RNA polymerase sigma factor n=3 Tax=Clostridium scindens (strain JCM 10418 / VPI 12708) TaxID=29347 RepID=UPI0022F39637|nr:sigma-70 family RNA polymerase sigma factor [[Clostridium] scindens]
MAEDLMQETFLKALCSMELSQDAVLPWLLRVAKNLYIDAWRKQRHHTEAKKYQAIQALKAPEREAVVLYYFAGLSQADIARQLGMSHGNVRVMLHRAKQRLRNLLQD